MRVTDVPLTQCREIVFSVDTGDGAKVKQAWYVASPFHQENGWK